MHAAGEVHDAAHVIAGLEDVDGFAAVAQALIDQELTPHSVLHAVSVARVEVAELDHVFVPAGSISRIGADLGDFKMADVGVVFGEGAVGIDGAHFDGALHSLQGHYPVHAFDVELELGLRWEQSAAAVGGFLAVGGAYDREIGVSGRSRKQADEQQ